MRARERPEGHAPRRLRVPHLTPEHPPMIWGGIGAAVGGSVAASARAGIAAGVLLVGGALVPGGGGYSSPRPSAGRASYDDLRIVAHDEGVEFFQVSRRRPWRAGEVRPHRDQVHSTGWLVPEEVVAWYRAADVLVVPSRYEGLGMRLILNGRG